MRGLWSGLPIGSVTALSREIALTQKLPLIVYAFALGIPFFYLRRSQPGALSRDRARSQRTHVIVTEPSLLSKPSTTLWAQAKLRNLVSMMLQSRNHEHVAQRMCRDCDAKANEEAGRETGARDVTPVDEAYDETSPWRGLTRVSTASYHQQLQGMQQCLSETNGTSCVDGN